jgi:hypothetical protein
MIAVAVAVAAASLVGGIPVIVMYLPLLRALIMS